MDIVVVGINHKTAPVEVREKLAFSDSTAGLCLERIQSKGVAQEAVVLSTCNRVEVYCVREKKEAKEDLIRFLSSFHETSIPDFETQVYCYQDKEAIQQLFRVTSGLDSMVLGENEVFGQVKKAYALAQKHQSTGPILNNLFQTSFNVSKYLRTETGLDRGTISVSSIAIDLAEKIFGELTNRGVLLVGAGKISQLTGKYLISKGVKGIIASNRSFEKAQSLANQLKGRAIQFDQMHDAMKDVDIIISSTSAPHFILNYDEVAGFMSQRPNRPLFIIDLAVPRDVESSVNEIDQVYLYNIDDLNEISNRNVQLRKKEVTRADAYIDKEAHKFMHWVKTLEVIPTIKILKDKLENIRRLELDKSFADLKIKNPDQYAEIDALTKKIINQILHHPLTRLKSDKNLLNSIQHIESLRDLFDLVDTENKHEK